MRFVSSIACVLSFTGAANAATVNWPQPGLNAAHTGYNKKETAISAANIGSLTQKWATPIPNGIYGPAPIELNGVAYGLSADGTVYAVNATTGAIIWTYATGGAPRPVLRLGAPSSTPRARSTERPYGICALKAATGTVVWKFTINNVGGQVPSDSSPDNVPVVDHGRVFFSEAFWRVQQPRFRRLRDRVERGHRSGGVGDISVWSLTKAAGPRSRSITAKSSTRPAAPAPPSARSMKPTAPPCSAPRTSVAAASRAPPHCRPAAARSFRKTTPSAATQFLPPSMKPALPLSGRDRFRVSAAMARSIRRPWQTASSISTPAGTATAACMRCR